MTEDQREVDADTGAAPPKKSPVGLILILVTMIIVLGVGGFLGWNQFMKNDAAGTANTKQSLEKASDKKDQTASIIVPLETFIVNLLDRSGLGKRYLKVTIELEIAAGEGQDTITSHKTQLRDTILLLLSGLSLNEINTIEGKLDLKQSLLSRINQVMGSGVVRRIYFTEFVLQ